MDMFLTACAMDMCLTAWAMDMFLAAASVVIGIHCGRVGNVPDLILEWGTIVSEVQLKSSLPSELLSMFMALNIGICQVVVKNHETQVLRDSAVLFASRVRMEYGSLSEAMSSGS